MARFCEYQIAHVAVGKNTKAIENCAFYNYHRACICGQTRKRANCRITSRGETMKRMELLPVTDQNRIVAVEKPQKNA